MQDVTAAIIIDNDKVLIARRSPNEKHAGKWEFPGGKVEIGESPEHCLHRELYEELGVESDIGNFFAESLFNYAAGTIRLLTFEVKLCPGVITPTVHDQIQWVKFSDLLHFDLLPADVPIAKKIKENFT